MVSAKLLATDAQIIEACCAVTGENPEMIATFVQLGDAEATKVLNAVKAAIELELSLRETNG